MVAKWELGTRAVAPYNRVLLCVLFESSAEELGLLEPEEEAARWRGTDRPSDGRDGLERREFVSLAGAASVAAAAATSSRSARTSAAASPPPGARPAGDPQEDLGAITARLRSLDGQLGPRYVLNAALAHQGLAVSLLRDARLEHREKLAFAAADVTGLVAWLSFDISAFDASFAHYRAAATLAEEAGDPGFHAWVLGSEALTFIHLGQDKEAVAVLDAARQIASRCPYPTVRSWLFAVAAHTHSRLGEQHTAWKYYGAAEKILDQGPGPDGVPTYVSFFRPAHVASSGGRVYLASGQARNARRELERALALHPPHLVRERAQFLTHLAEAHLAERDLDAACGMLGDAFDIATRTQSTRIVERVRTVRRAVDRKYGDSNAVRALDERIGVVAAASNRREQGTF